MYLGLWYDYNLLQVYMYQTTKVRFITSPEYLNCRTKWVQSVHVTSVSPKWTISIGTFPLFPSKFHICVTFLITQSSLQVSVSVSV